MAISKDLSDAENRTGIPINGSYSRIVSASVQRRNDTPKFVVCIDVSSYATSAIGEQTMEVAFQRWEAPIAEVNAAAGDEFLDKCYSWVMAQPSMVGATAA